MNLKGRTQCRELPLCAGSGEGGQWQALPSPVQCEETATRTRDLPVTGGKTLPLAPGNLVRENLGGTRHLLVRRNRHQNLSWKGLGHE